MEYLRVIASFMIILFHAHSIANNHATAQHVAFFAAPVFWYSCIELFFVMSGFLMIHMSSSLYGQKGGLRNFVLRRVTRTPPLYWLYTLGIAAILALKPSLSNQGPVTFGQLLGSICFFPMARNPVIAIGWTLEYEVFFYTIIGISILLPFRWGWRFALAVLASLTLAGAALGVHSNPWAVWTDPTLLDFAIGIIVAVGYYSGVTLSGLGRWVAFGLGLVLVCSLHRLVDRDWLRVATMGVGIGLVVASATLSARQWSVGRFHGLAHALSNQTYTMYLCHILVLKLYELAYFRFFHGAAADVVFIVTGFLIVVGASRVLYLLTEKPVTDFFKGLLKKWQAPRREISARVEPVNPRSA